MLGLSVSAVLLALATVAAAAPKAHQLDATYSFDAYVRDFKKEYASQAEMALRRDAFVANLDKILLHNADPAQTWRMGVNAFTDEPAAAFKSRLGFLGSHASVRPKASFAVTRPQNSQPLRDLPDSVDWRNKGVISPVKNQGMCGSCWAVRPRLLCTASSRAFLSVFALELPFFLTPIFPPSSKNSLAPPRWSRATSPSTRVCFLRFRLSNLCRAPRTRTIAGAPVAAMAPSRNWFVYFCGF
jgi:hypothetical protein